MSALKLTERVLTNVIGERMVLTTDFVVIQRFAMAVSLALSFFIFGYLSGSLPFSIWITHLVKGVDVRDSGSGHATTTNTIRQAGFGPGALVLILDIAKGFIPTWLAFHYAFSFWIVPITAALIVVGHCWPVFAQFRGGMGLACAGGGLLAVSPLAFLIAGGDFNRTRLDPPSSRPRQRPDRSWYGTRTMDFRSA